MCRRHYNDCLLGSIGLGESVTWQSKITEVHSSLKTPILKLPNMPIVYIFGHIETRPTLSLLALQAVARG